MQVNKSEKVTKAFKAPTFGNLGGWRREKEGNGGLLERETGAALVGRERWSHVMSPFCLF